MPNTELIDRFPDVVYTSMLPPNKHPMFNYKGFKPGKVILQKGHQRFPGVRAFPTDCVYDRDVTITVRDGSKLYADVFRPVNSDTEKVPAIIPWSPYGKTGTGPQNYDFMAPFRAGIPKDRTSGYEKFEAPDPAEWCCERGYAIINIDARGAGHSEGKVAAWGEQEAEDVHDVIDWVSKQPWSTGAVAMAGNSWLSISQINYASRLSHPALKAIAPWEAYTDLYKDVFLRGGRPHIPGFHKMISGGLAGTDAGENVHAMRDKRPLFDDYWDAKRIKVENIDNIPMYLLGSYSSMLHTHGSFHTFQVAKTKRKWLRVHPYQEWYDLYRQESSDDLQKFFDRYLRGIENGWESTPPVRLSLLGFEGSLAKTIIERPEQAYPLKRQQLQTYYLDASKKILSKTPSQEISRTSYESHSLDDSADFTIYFNHDTELAGYPKLRIHVSCADHNDFDVCVQIRKISASGTPLVQLNYPVPVPESEVPDVNTAKTLGPQGFLRASHAHTLAPSPFPNADPNDLYYKHDSRRFIEPGTVVALEIPIWPIGMVFKKGEGIMLRVSGHDMSFPETEMCRIKVPEDDNVGRHTVWTGGKYDSALVVPVIHEG